MSEDRVEDINLNPAQKHFLEFFYLPQNNAVKQLIEDCIKNNNLIKKLEQKNKEYMVNNELLKSTLDEFNKTIDDLKIENSKLKEENTRLRFGKGNDSERQDLLIQIKELNSDIKRKDLEIQSVKESYLIHINQTKINVQEASMQIINLVNLLKKSFADLPDFDLKQIKTNNHEKQDDNKKVNPGFNLNSSESENNFKNDQEKKDIINSENNLIPVQNEDDFESNNTSISGSIMFEYTIEDQSPIQNKNTDNIQMEDEIANFDPINSTPINLHHSNYELMDLRESSSRRNSVCSSKSSSLANITNSTLTTNFNIDSPEYIVLSSDEEEVKKSKKKKKKPKLKLKSKKKIRKNIEKETSDSELPNLYI